MKTLFSFTLVVLVSFTAWAQNPPGPFLESADIDRYIATGSQMMQEFETLEDRVEEEVSEGDSYEEILRVYQQALKSNEATAIIEKYGWETETFGAKMMAIAMGTTYLIAEKHMKDMPAEQRAMMEEMFTKQYKSMVHPADLDMLKPKLSELEAFFNQQ